jgi:excinuclease ABC subunit C
VLTRRLAHIERDDEPEAPELDADGVPTGARRKKFAYRPGLIIVDGGQPQVEAAQRALTDAGVDIPICGLAKRLEEIWQPGSDFPVILPRNSEALFLMQRIRDEAHRFAITFQRQKRRTDISSVLGEVPGLGPSRVKVLLKHFGSVARLKAAQPADILEVPGIGPALAEAIVTKLGTAPTDESAATPEPDEEPRTHG